VDPPAQPNPKGTTHDLPSDPFIDTTVFGIDEFSDQGDPFEDHLDPFCDEEDPEEDLHEEKIHLIVEQIQQRSPIIPLGLALTRSRAGQIKLSRQNSITFLDEVLGQNNEPKAEQNTQQAVPNGHSNDAVKASQTVENTPKKRGRPPKRSATQELKNEDKTVTKVETSVELSNSIETPKAVETPKKRGRPAKTPSGISTDDVDSPPKKQRKGQK